MAIAEAPITDPPDNALTVAAVPAESEAQPVIVYTTGADPPTPIDLTPLLQAYCAWLSPYHRVLFPWITAKYSAEKRQRFAAAYSTIVYAAEQIFAAGQGDKKL